MIFHLKKLVSLLPTGLQSELKRIHYWYQIKRGSFNTDEPEYKLLRNFIVKGSWVIDIGANIGHYSKRFSDLVGCDGRVIAFEPIPETFAILAANLRQAECDNVSLFNAAVSDKTDVVGMNIPSFKTGLKNYYQAHLTTDSKISELKVISLQIDRLELPGTISLVKIDAEGHELKVLEGMKELLCRDHPILIVETDQAEIVELLKCLGYVNKKISGSPNMLFIHHRNLLNGETPVKVFGPTEL